MRTIGFHPPRKLPLRKKLFVYMLVLAAIILISAILGMFMFGRFNSTAKSTYEALELQMEVFEKDILTHFDYIAAAGISLSEDIAFSLEQHLHENGYPFSRLREDDEKILSVQKNLAGILSQKLFQEDASGIFVMLDSSVHPQSENSYSGIYLQTNGYEPANRNITLYRGCAALSDSMDIMPHRKWRLEFTDDMFGEYFRIMNSGLSCDEAYRFSSLIRLPGMSEKAIFLICPILSSHGEFFGICGFEISESCFTTHHAQPSRISRLTCMLSESNPDGSVRTENTLSCGVSKDYYLAPTGIIGEKSMSGGLMTFFDTESEYVGLKRTVSLSPNNDPYIMFVMISGHDYDNMLGKDTLQNIILLLLILFFTINICLFFSKKFISPVLSGLDGLKSEEANPGSDIPEINDLFEFLARKDMENESVVEDLLQKQEEVRRQMQTLQQDYEKAKSDCEKALTEINRLCYQRRKEVDPDDYRIFREGINTLTPTERKIFDYYLSGKSVKEILLLADIKESTLRFHNKNIYGKLGVNSLKQLLRYATLTENDNEE